MFSVTRLSSILCCLALISTPVYADTVFGVYAGAGTWKQELSGNVTSNISRVDIEDDLALDDDDNTVLYVAVEHGLPFLPNVRAQHFAIDVDGSNVLSRTVEFNGQTFTLSDQVNTAVDLTQTDGVLYYEVLDNVVSLDLGLAVSIMEGSIDIASATENARAEFDEAVPMVYAKARADLPFTGFWVAAEAQGISYEDNTVTEFVAQVGYESDLGLGVEAGWRSVQIELDAFDDVDTAEIDISGPYAALNFHF